jgi:Holliday junction resolvase RusA-like endonuclease
VRWRNAQKAARTVSVDRFMSERQFAEHQAGAKGSATVPEISAPLHEPKRSFSLILPWPPTTNHSHTGNHHLTEETREFRKQVSKTCVLQRVMPLSGSLSLSIICFQADNRKRDIGNLEKQTSDALVSCGMIKDEDIDHIEITRVRGVDDAHVSVTMREI